MVCPQSAASLRSWSSHLLKWLSCRMTVVTWRPVLNITSKDSLEPYKESHCYLDNDIAEQKTVETFIGLFEGKVKDESARYREYKDLNDLLRGKKQ